MLRLALLLALPAWSAAAIPIARAGGRRASWLVMLALAAALAAWAGSRVGTANPLSRTARWDPWLVALLGVALLAIPGAASTWGVTTALAQGKPGWMAAGAGVLAGLVALPIAFVLAVLVEVLWPH